MKSKQVFILVLALIYLLSYCTTNTNDETFFDREINYTPVTTKQRQVFDNIYNPRRMRIIGDRLFVSDFQNEPAFHVLQIEDDGSLTYLRGEGKRGRGPGEFEMIDDFIDADSLIYIYDGGQLKLVSYDRMGRPSPYDEIHLRIENRPMSMSALPEGRFAAGGLFYRERFHVYDSEGNVVGQHGKQIELSENFTPRDLAIAWYSTSVGHPTKGYVYIFSREADFIEKYHADGTLLKRMQGDRFPLPRKRLEMSNGQPWPVDDGGKLTYLWADTGADYIYALYSGKMRADVERVTAKRIHKLDWDLNLAGAYELDHAPHSNLMAADGAGGLYTITLVEGGTEFRYQKLD